MSAIAVPTAQRKLRIDWPAVDVDLEVEVAANGAGVAGLADEADRLASPDALAVVDESRTGHVGVEVRAILAFAVYQQVVAVEDRVIAGAQDAPVADGHQRRAAGGDDVEAFVGAAAIAGSAEFADGPAGSVGPLNREDVAVEGRGAVIRGDPRRGWYRQNR